MARLWLSVAVLVLLLVGASLGGAAQTTGSNGFADVLVGDLVIGESEQTFPGLRALEFPADAETVRVELDLAVLAEHGVDLSDAEVVVADAAVHGATVETATVDAGRVHLVFAPDGSNDDAVIEVEEFRLVGLDTADAEAAQGVTFDATYSDGEARVRSFDIVDPEAVAPTLDPTRLFTEAPTHRVTLRDLHAIGENVTVELDVGVLEGHGFDLANLDADVTADGASVSSTAVDGGVLTVVLSPAEDTVLFDVVIDLRGLDPTASDPTDRVIATDVAYDVAIDGAADEDVEVEPFDIAMHHTTHADPVTTTSGPSLIVKGDGFGPAVVAAAVALLGLLARRRS